MDLRRPRLGDWIGGLGGAALLVSLFLPWYGGCAESCYLLAGSEPPDGLTAWRSFAVLDLLLLVTALFGIAMLAFSLTQRVAAVPIATAAITAIFSTAAAVWVLVRVVELPGPDAFSDRRFGLYVGLGSTVAVAAGAWLSMRDEGFGVRPAPGMEATLGGGDPLAEVPVVPVPPAGEAAGSPRA